MQQMQNMQQQMQMQMQQQQQQQQQQQMLPVDQRFIADCHKILPAMVVENPNHKDQAGNVFFEYIKQFLGPEKAPKITGMLIDLQLDDIKHMMTNWTHFCNRVKQADDVLSGRQA